VEAIAWMHRAAPGARDGLPPQLRRERTVPLGAGALLRYVDSPVGPYAEVVATPLLLRGVPPLGHVPFIAVDSVPSLHGGRDHWALPKTLAAFDPDGDVRGDRWSLRITARTTGPDLPAVLPFAFTQLPGTRAGCLFRGRFRLARVELRGDGLPAWMATGRHPGAVASGRLRVGQPRSSS
jgi:hypothetical protein